MFAEAHVPVLGGVENMHGLVCPHCHAELEIFPSVRESRSIWSAGVKKLGELPFGPALAQLAERGQPLLTATPDDPQAERFRKIAARVVTALDAP